MMAISVLIPTYRRPKDIERCLEALKKQTRPADEVLIVVRDTDIETRKFLETFNPKPLPLKMVTVTTPGLIAAVNKGLDTVQGDIISITDDDAAPHPDWLERIESYFLLDSTIGGVGGRDWVHLSDRIIDGECKIVGKVQWFGRVIGNHHLGAGESREVDVLKGVNASYRRTALAQPAAGKANLRADERLRTTGIATHYDLAFSLALNRTGWKLIYDPAIAVDHYEGERLFMAHRHEFNAVALTDSVYNQTLILLEHFQPLQRVIFTVWAILVGTRASPGVLQCLRLFPSEGKLVIRKLFGVLNGLWQAWQSWRKYSEKHS